MTTLKSTYQKMAITAELGLKTQTRGLWWGHYLASCEVTSCDGIAWPLLPTTAEKQCSDVEITSYT